MSLLLCVFVCVCVCVWSLRLKRGSRTVGATNLRKYLKKSAFVNHERPLFGPTRSGARQPAETRSNPRWRRKKLGQCDPGRISANFSYPEGSISFDSFDFSGESADMTSRPKYLKCPTHLKRGIRTVGAKNLKKYPKDAESWITEGRFSDQPDRKHQNTANHWNPFEPAMTKAKTWPMGSSSAFGEFPPLLRVDFLLFLRLSVNPQLHVTTNTISIEFYVV